MAHELDIEPPRKHLGELHEQFVRGLDLTVEQETPDRAGGAAREREQAPPSEPPARRE